MRGVQSIRIEPWSEHDFPLLEKLLGDPEMTKHLGGPESPKKLAERQEKYERLVDSPTDRMFKIVDASTGEAIGSVGYWQRTWHDATVYETGWSVLPAFQGRGIAGMATAQAIAAARAEGKNRFMYAYPSVDNPQSNAICRKLGFTLEEVARFEYPPGNPMQCNVWRLDLTSG